MHQRKKQGWWSRDSNASQTQPLVGTHYAGSAECCEDPGAVGLCAGLTCWDWFKLLFCLAAFLLGLAAIIWLIVASVTGAIGDHSDDDSCNLCCWKEEPLWEEDFTCDQCFDDPEEPEHCEHGDWHNMECKKKRDRYRGSHCRYYEWGRNAPECEHWRRKSHDKHRRRHVPEECKNDHDSHDEHDKGHGGYRRRYGKGGRKEKEEKEEEEPCRFKLVDQGEFGLANDSLGGIKHRKGMMCIDSTPFSFTVPQQGNGPHPAGALDHVKFLSFIRDEDDPTMFEAFHTYKDDDEEDDDDDGHHGGRKGKRRGRKGKGKGKFRKKDPHDDRDEEDEEAECEPELLYEGKVKCEVTGATRHPYPNALVPTPDEDPRLASCALNSVAFEEFNDGVSKGAWLVADFFITNNRIFALYERLPFGKPSFGGNLNEYFAGTHLIPVAYRTPDEWHKLGIAFNHQLGIIRWLIEDVEVFRVNRVGFPLPLCDRAIDHGGTPEEIFPKFMSFGFGTFTLLDAHHYNNGSCTPNPGLARLMSGGMVYRNPFDLDPAGNPRFNDVFHHDVTVPKSARLWRQGAKLCIKHLAVRKQRCDCLQT